MRNYDAAAHLASIALRPRRAVRVMPAPVSKTKSEPKVIVAREPSFLERTYVERRLMFVDPKPVAVVPFLPDPAWICVDCEKPSFRKRSGPRPQRCTACIRVRASQQNRDRRAAALDALWVAVIEGHPPPAPAVVESAVIVYRGERYAFIPITQP